MPEESEVEILKSLWYAKSWGPFVGPTGSLQVGLTGGRRAADELSLNGGEGVGLCSGLEGGNLMEGLGVELPDEAGRRGGRVISAVDVAAISSTPTYSFQSVLAALTWSDSAVAGNGGPLTGLASVASVIGASGSWG